MTRRQCKKCPWKVDTDPFEIPNGYSEELHQNLECTIARPGEIRIGGGVRVMACHESKPGAEIPCVGWVANQLGPGNNIGLRMMAMSDRSIVDFSLDGEQHERFEDTLP